MPFFSLVERALVPRHPEEDLVAGQGNVLIGVFLGIFLYGVGVHQAYRYIRNFPSDSGYIRLLVIFVMILETLHVLANMHSSFYYLILHFYDVHTLRGVVWSEAVSPVIAAAVVLVAQIFFVRRVYLIGPRQRIFAIVVAIALAFGVLFSIASAGVSFSKANGRPALVSLLGGASLLLAGVADTALTIALIQAFRSHRAAKLRGLESTIDVIRLYVLNSGVATGTFNFLAFMIAVYESLQADSVSFGYMPFAIISVRLYANTLLAVLNSRELQGMEFLLSTSSTPIMVEGAQFVDLSSLWSVPKPRPRSLLLEMPAAAAALRGEKPGLSSFWSPTSPEYTNTKRSYYGGYRYWEGFD